MKATWLDRTIGWISPTRGARRLQARAVMETLAGYEGARIGRRTEGWQTPTTSADSFGQGQLGTLRERARHLAANAPYGARATEVKVSHTIGTGITAEVKNRALSRMWDEFVESCDVDGHYDLFGLLAQVERCRFVSGECLIRFYESGAYGSAALPTQIRVLEPDYLDETRDTMTPEGGGWIKQGIEYTEAGRLRGYWLFPEHPGEASLLARRRLSRSSEFVPAEDIVHVFRKLRPGQTRGVSEFAPVMMRLRDLDDADDAEVLRMKIQACLVGIFTTSEGLAGSAIGPQSQTEGEDEDLTKERMRPGTFYRARPGETVTFSNPSGSTGYADFKKLNARDVAAGTGIPYELMTGDLSELNYTSMRGGLVDFRKRIEADQWLLYVPRVCRRIERRFRKDAARLAPGVGARAVFEWTPPKFELMDPLKENQADLEAVLAGFVPLSEIQRQRGWSQAEILQAIVDTLAELDRLGIGSILKSDPRTKAQSSATPVEPNAANDEGAQAA